MRFSEIAASDWDRALLGLYTARTVGGTGAGLERFLPPGRTTFYGYGRQALAEGLRRLGVGNGDEVLLPGLICREVLASLAAVGAVPRLFEVDENLQSGEKELDRAGARKPRAVIAVNYFGIPQPLAPFHRWCETHGAALIEDNAHGFLSADGEQPLGLRGDLGVFSLRKTLALPNGAALVDNRPDALVPRAAAPAYIASPRRAERRYRAKAIVKHAMSIAGGRGAHAFVSSIRLARRLATGSPLPRVSPEAETAMPAEAFAPLTKRLLNRLDVNHESARRRQLFEQVRQMLADVSGIRPLIENLPAGAVLQGYPFIVSGIDPDRFVALWWRRGVQMLRWPDLPRAIERGAPAHYRNLVLVPFLW